MSTPKLCTWDKVRSSKQPPLFSLRFTLLMHILLALLTLPFPLFSQPSPSAPIFRHYNVEDGLSQGSINAILQDHKGFIWIATHDGLNRFDGTEFKVFRNIPGDTTSLSSNWILGVMEDSANILWVQTENNVDRFDRAQGTFDHFPELSKGLSFVPRRGGASGFWTGGNALRVFDAEQRSFRETEFLMSDGKAMKIQPERLVPDARGFLWVAGNSLLLKLNTENSVVERSTNVNRIAMQHLLPGRSRPNVLWFGGPAGLFRIHEDSVLKLGAFNVTALAEDPAGFLWVGTMEGLIRLHIDDTSGSSAVRFQHNPAYPKSLSHNIVTSILHDASGSMWVGTYNGLNLFDKFSPLFTVYKSSKESNSLAGNFVIPIVEDTRGNIWFGTFGSGVSVLWKHGQRAGTFSHFQNDPSVSKSLRGNNVRSLVAMRDGRVVIGTVWGINVFDPVSNSLSFLSGLGVEAMTQARDGSLWCCLGGKLVRFNASLTAADTIFLDRVHQMIAVQEDSRGDLWIATSGSGLIRFDPRTQTTTAYIHDAGKMNSLSNDNVWCVFEDIGEPQRTLWVGTSRGLNRFDVSTGSWVRFFEQDGFPNSWVYGILQDDTGRLWLSTNHGLVVFDKQGRFRNYTYADGLAGNEFNRRSYLRLSNGEFLFGGTNGVTRFRPSDIVNNPVQPPLVLNGFSRMGQPMTFESDIVNVSSIVLNHNESSFSFSFVSLNFSNPSTTTYAYMMEGLDRDWVNIGNQRSVNVAHVPPGSYVFRVRASQGGGLWNPNEIAVRMTVRPPFWSTWWFVTLCVLTVGGGIFWAIKVRVRRLLEMERMRSRIARDLHDEIGSNLSSIAMASELLGRRSGLDESERGKLSEISSVALNTVKDMKDIVWLIRPGNDSLDDLFLRMKDTATTLLDGQDVQLNFPSEHFDTKIDLDWKRNLYLVYKEVLTNIVRHAHATTTRIDVRVTAERLSLEIQDNGRGFEPGSISSGNGLRNIRERAQLMDADIAIESVPNGGTIVRLIARIT